MSVSPFPAPSASPSATIAVTPSLVGGAAGAVAALAGDVRAQAPVSPGAPATDVVGDAHCFAALTDASRLLGEALEASARSLDELARALHTAAGAYGLADLLAVAPERS